MFNLIIALLLEGFLVLGGSPTLTLSPTQGFAPLSTRGRVVIEPDPRNREWCLTWDSDSEEGETGVSCKPLEGEKAPRTHPILLRDLPQGLYVVKVVVFREGAEELRSTPIHVNSVGDSR